MIYNLPSLTLVLFALLITRSGFTQDLEDEIVVKATRIEKSTEDIAASIALIDRQNIQIGRQQVGLDEALSSVSGLFIQDRYNFAQDLRIAIRGFGARSNFGIRGVKIIVDDIPATLPDGQGQVDAIDLGSIDQVEILKGPSSSLYGNASGGAINIVSEQGASEPFIEGRVSIGAYDFSKTQLKLSGQTPRLNYLVSASHLDYEGYREQSETRNTQLNSRFDYNLNQNQSLRLIFNVTDQPLANDPGGINLSQAAEQADSARDRNLLFDAGESLEQQKIGLVYQHQFNSAHALQIRNYYVWRDFANRLPFEGGGAVAIDRTFSGLGALYTYESPQYNTWLVGIDYDRQDDDRRRFDNLSGVLGDLVFDQNELVTSLGLFMQTDLDLNEQTKLNIGLRYDRIEFDVTDRFLSNGDDSGRRRLDELSPTVGLLFAFQADGQIFLNWSSSFETPTTTEFANPLGTGGFNPNLDAQFSRSYELGLRNQIGAKHSYELAVFHIEVDNELIPFELVGQEGRDFFENAGESSRNGLEVTWVSELNRSFKFSLAYTFSDFKFDQFLNNDGDDFSNNRIPGVPRNQVFAELKYTNDHGTYAAIDWLRVNDVYLNNANSAIESTYSVSNLRMGAEQVWGRWTVSPFIGVNNLFDRVYFSNLRINAFGSRFYEPAPERHVYAGFSARFMP